MSTDAEKFRGVCDSLLGRVDVLGWVPASTMGPRLQREIDGILPVSDIREQNIVYSMKSPVFWDFCMANPEQRIKEDQYLEGVVHQRQY